LNDPQIAATNENFELINQPITLFGINKPSSSDIAYLEWVGRQTGENVNQVKAVELFDEYSLLVEKMREPYQRLTESKWNHKAF
jgi:hypothetical protein